MKTIFTVGEVAKICKVAPRTVSKWFDSGRLRGYRIPGSQDRRIPREHLIRFLKEHGMPLGELEDESLIKVLLVLSDSDTRHMLEDAGNGEFKIVIAASGFEAGIQIESIVPDCVVVDCASNPIEAVCIAESIRRMPALIDSSLIALIGSEFNLNDEQRSMFSNVFLHGTTVVALAERIRTLYRS